MTSSGSNNITGGATVASGQLIAVTFVSRIRPMLSFDVGSLLPDGRRPASKAASVLGIGVASASTRTRSPPLCLPGSTHSLGVGPTWRADSGRNGGGEDDRPSLASRGSPSGRHGPQVDAQPPVCARSDR